jgi:hypothetical protein
MSRGVKNVVRPEDHLSVTALPREADALLDEPLTDALSARARLNEKTSPIS